MKDDNLSDAVNNVVKQLENEVKEVSYCNIKEGMHNKAKELNIPAYNLGCSCEECNKEFDKVLDKIDEVQKVNEDFAQALKR